MSRYRPARMDSRGRRTVVESSRETEAAEILREALALPSEARAALAGSPLDSLDIEVDEDAEAAGQPK